MNLLHKSHIKQPKSVAAIIALFPALSSKLLKIEHNLLWPGIQTLGLLTRLSNEGVFAHFKSRRMIVKSGSCEIIIALKI
jgi:hypothetical protein